MNARTRVAHVLAWGAIYVFVLLLGAHLFDTWVLVPHWTAAHLALVFIFFIPTNESLGFFASDPATLELDAAVAR